MVMVEQELDVVVVEKEIRHRNLPRRWGLQRTAGRSPADRYCLFFSALISMGMT